jgi:carbonic anhydrase/acetyltransferase-like protein (isoleucine patch superfamily)
VEPPIVLPFRGHTPKIAADVFLAPGASVIGDVVIGSRSSVWFGCVLRGDTNFVRIGEGTNIQDGTIVHVTHDGNATLIGSDVTIGHGCILHACTLEDGSFIGMGSTVLDGAVVESGAMAAAGSLVTPGKRIPRGQLWAGRPARYLRELTPDDHAAFAERAAHYVELAAEYLRARPR